MLRSQLLKAGKKAYVPESEGAFLNLEEAKNLFLSLGGIPVYPVLADGAGGFTDWEKTPGELAARLKLMGYKAVEFIPRRNSPETLLEYAEVLNEKGFIITAGTEHNTPEPHSLIPLPVNSTELPGSLGKIFWRGCCAVAAHQERRAGGREGFVDSDGNPSGISADELAEEGGRIIRRCADGFKQRA